MSNTSYLLGMNPWDLLVYLFSGVYMLPSDHGIDFRLQSDRSRPTRSSGADLGRKTRSPGRPPQTQQPAAQADRRHGPGGLRESEGWVPSRWVWVKRPTKVEEPGTPCSVLFQDTAKPLVYLPDRVLVYVSVGITLQNAGSKSEFVLRAPDMEGRSDEGILS